MKAVSFAEMRPDSKRTQPGGSEERNTKQNDMQRWALWGGVGYFFYVLLIMLIVF